VFLWAFAIWDIFYYAALWATVRWPLSLRDPDILFLIPVPWLPRYGSAPGKRPSPRRRPPCKGHAIKELSSLWPANKLWEIRGGSCHPSRFLCIKEMPWAAKFILGACRPGPLISAPLRAHCRIMWISLLLAVASRAFPLRPGCAGSLPGAPFWCLSLLRLVMAPVAAPAVWRWPRPRPASSPDSATCSPATRKFSALSALTRA